MFWNFAEHTALSLRCVSAGAGRLSILLPAAKDGGAGGRGLPALLRAIAFAGPRPVSAWGCAPGLGLPAGPRYGPGGAAGAGARLRGRGSGGRGARSRSAAVPPRGEPGRAVRPTSAPPAINARRGGSGGRSAERLGAVAAIGRRRRQLSAAGHVRARPAAPTSGARPCPPPPARRGRGEEEAGGGAELAGGQGQRRRSGKDGHWPGAASSPQHPPRGGGSGSGGAPAGSAAPWGAGPGGAGERWGCPWPLCVPSRRGGILLAHREGVTSARPPKALRRVVGAVGISHSWKWC